MLESVCFLVPEKEEEKRSHVAFRLRFQLPAGSSRRCNLRRFEDSEILFQIYLGYEKKSVYEKFWGVKKKGITGDAKVLKVTNLDFSNRLGESGLFGRLGTQCVTAKFQKPRVKQESLWLLGKIKVKGSYSFVLNSLEFRKTEHSRNQDSTVRTMDGKLKRMAVGVALSYVNFK